jgi:hypothetical protein
MPAVRPRRTRSEAFLPRRSRFDTISITKVCATTKGGSKTFGGTTKRGPEGYRLLPKWLGSREVG